MQFREDLSPIRRRAGVLLFVTACAILVLFLRLVHLQLINGSEWRRLAENNRLRTLPLECSRGWIYDRSGLVLAHDVPAWSLLLFPDEARSIEETVLLLSRIGIAEAATLHQEVLSSSAGHLAPIIIGENLSWRQVAQIRAHQSDFPELSVVRRYRRSYPSGQIVAHAVGYLRPISESELAEQPQLGGDALVGATGVEASHNQILAGVDGERWVVVSAVGQQLGVVRERQPVAGNSLSLTLDLELQEVAARAMGSAAGGIVALDPSTGAVRVLYSSPSFDPNLFVGRLSQDTWRTIRDDPLHPMQNRCTQGVYPPASTVKPFLALGGLAEGVITRDWGVSCRGSVTLHGNPFRCWQRWGHGPVGLRRSLAVSCDTFYYLLGQRLGIDRMAKWLTRFGFGQPSGGGFPGEKPGLVGTPEWKRRVRKQPWYPGEAVSVSIGQGPLDATVLQVARACAALANGGWLVTPHLVAGQELQQRPVHLDLDPEDLQLVQEGMIRAVDSAEGTARRLGVLSAAGKTGTAQVSRLEDGVSLDDVDPKLRHHAWFMGWAPAENPKIAVAVIIEHGGGGGTVAAPIAGKVLAAALARRQPAGGG